MNSTLLLLLMCAPVETDVDTVVVCPAELRQALEPWLAHRRAQGHRLAVLSNLSSAHSLRDEVRRIARAGTLRSVVLVGDADPGMARDPGVRRRSVPTYHTAAVVIRKFGGEADIATDNWYADLNDDRLPDVAVGRLTADSPEELAAMIRKILTYETSVDFGRWRSQLHFVAGMGGFGPLADAALEAAAKTLISQSVPAAYDVSMTYASFQSPYCPDPRRFRSVAVERFNEGSLFWVYLGHGDQRALDPVRVPGRVYPSFSARDTPRLDCRHGAPVACFLACYTGAFDQPQDCLAEELLRQPGGPVAVVCGTRMTMPYAMTVMGSELLDECFAGRHQLLGQLLLAAKRRTMEPARADSPRAAIESAAKALGLGGADLEAERAEHLDLFQLLGDPLLRLPLPRHVELEVPAVVIAGRRLAIRGDSTVAGTATVELVVRRGRPTAPSPRRTPFDSDRLAEYDEVYKQANEPRLASARLEVPQGRFDLELVVPDSAGGACHVRAFVEGRDDCAIGAAALRIEAPDSSAAR